MARITQKVSRGASVIGASIAVVLAGKGWVVRNDLGGSAPMEKDGESLFS